eukprot:scaffold394446_cov42-Prasinocladus_malaysianus.AAC.1
MRSYSYSYSPPKFAYSYCVGNYRTVEAGKCPSGRVAKQLNTMSMSMSILMSTSMSIYDDVNGN